jgi:hypothetical protein
MSKIPQPFRPAADVALPLRPQPPAWVVKLFAGRDARPEDVPGQFGDRLTSRRIERFTLLSAAIGDPTDLSADDLANAVARVYRSVGHELERQRRHAVRLWNFVPDIQGRVGEGDRYMAFNVGRLRPDLLVTSPRSLRRCHLVGRRHRQRALIRAGGDQGGVREPPPDSAISIFPAGGSRPPCFAERSRVDAVHRRTASILGEDGTKATSKVRPARRSQILPF